MSTGKRLALLVNISLLIMIRNIGFCGDYSTVTNLWWNGYKTNVLAIAERRLEANTNDFVGLILEMEYHMAYMEIDDLTNVASRVFSLAPTIQGQAFSQKKELFTMSLQHLTNVAASCSLTSEEISRERKKGDIPHKHLGFERFLKALDDDGFFEGTQNEDE